MSLTELTDINPPSGDITNPGAPGAMMSAQCDMFLAGMGQVARDMAYFGNNAGSVSEVSHETGKTWEVYNSENVLGNSLQIRTEELSRYVWLPSESFFKFQFVLTDGNSTAKSVNNSSLNMTWASGKTYPLKTRFNGVDSLVESIQIKLNGQDIVLMTTNEYHRESKIIKYVYATKGHERNHVLDGNYLATLDDTEPDWTAVTSLADINSSTTLTKSVAGAGFYDPEYAWFSRATKLGQQLVKLDGTEITLYWRPYYRLFLDTVGRWFPCMRLEMTFKLLEQNLEYCVQRNPVRTSSQTALTTAQNTLAFSKKFDALTFYACVLDSPAEILRAQNPGVDGTVLSHLAQVRNMTNYSFHNKFRLHRFANPDISGNVNVMQFNVLNHVRRIWFQICPRAIENKKTGLGTVDWTASAVRVYKMARYNYFQDAEWDYSDVEMGDSPNQGGMLAWQRFQHSRIHHNPVWQDRIWQGGQKDFMLRSNILTWSYDTDYMDRHRIMEKQVVNYKIEVSVNPGVDKKFIADSPAKATSAKVYNAPGDQTLKFEKADVDGYIWTMESEAIV